MTILFDKRTYGTKSLLSPAMAEWQGVWRGCDEARGLSINHSFVIKFFTHPNVQVDHRSVVVSPPRGGG